MQKVFPTENIFFPSPSPSLFFLDLLTFIMPDAVVTPVSDCWNFCAISHKK